MSTETEKVNIQVQTTADDIPPAVATNVYEKQYIGAKELVTLFISGEVNKFNLDSYLSHFMLNVFKDAVMMNQGTK